MGSERVSIPNAKSGFQSEWFFRLGGYKGGAHANPRRTDERPKSRPRSQPMLSLSCIIGKLGRDILASQKRETFRRSHGADAVDLKSVQTGADDYLH